MTQIQTTYRLASRNPNGARVCFIVEGEKVWVHYYGFHNSVQAEPSLSIIHPDTGMEFVVFPKEPLTLAQGKAVWKRFVEIGFIRG